MFQAKNKENTLNNKSNYFSRNLPISVFQEYQQYNQSLYQRSRFPQKNNHNHSRISRVIVSFRFRSIEFSKKRALPFFLAIELLTNRKCIASLSRRNVQAWKIRKGRLVGCKVTLRRNSLYDFIDTLALTFPRREKFQPSKWMIKQIKTYFSKYYLRKINKLQASYAFSLSELVLFYPIELGLGLHPDVQRININFIFNSLSIEERFFLLRSFKIPVLY